MIAKLSNTLHFLTGSFLRAGKNDGRNQSEDFRLSKPRFSDKQIHQAIDRFFDKIDFDSVEESITPESAEITKNAFLDLCHELEWHSVKLAFKDLLEQKSGDDALRKDEKTPNFYHELRNLYPVLSKLRSNIYTLENLRPHGGIQANLVARLWHDSYEDNMETPTALYAKLESDLHNEHKYGHLSDAELVIGRNQAAVAIEAIRLVSKKTSRLVENNDPHQFDIFDPSDDGDYKIETVDFFDGDQNKFYNNMLANYIAFSLKVDDGIEGLSTRTFLSQFTGESASFSVDKNISYAEDKRHLYGRNAMDNIAAGKWPEHEQSIRSADDMLGLTLTMLEIVNDYYKGNSKLDPQNALPARLDQYANALDNYDHVPECSQPHMIQISEFEAIARMELEKGETKMAEILENALYPSLIPFIGDRRGTLLKKSEWAQDFDTDKPGVF